MRKPLKTKIPITRSQLYFIVIYTIVLVVSNIISSRQVLFFNHWELTGAVILYPLTYIMSDVLSEVWGYKWSRKACYIAFAANFFVAIIGYLVCSLPSPTWWGDAAAFSTVLKAVPRITCASLLAFVLGGLIDDLVFKIMKKGKDNNGYGLRAIISSLFGELVDSCIFIPLAFIGSMPTEVLIKMIGLQVIVKVAYEIVLVPLNTYVMKKIKKAHTNELMEISPQLYAQYQKEFE